MLSQVCLSAAAIGTMSLPLGNWSADGDGDGDCTTLCDVGAVERQIPVTKIRIDFKPYSRQNTIEPGSRVNTSAAILGTATFDVTLIDPNSLRLGLKGARPNRFEYRDVDRNGYANMVGWFEIPQTGIKCGDQTVEFTAETLDGQALAGMDKVKTVGC